MYSTGNYLSNMAATCPDVDPPTGGKVSVETNGSVTMATYMCAPEYALYGDAERICQDNNTWAGVEPSCSE